MLPPLLLDGHVAANTQLGSFFTSLIIIQLIKFSTQNMEFELQNEKSDAKYCCQVCGDLATCYRCDVQQQNDNIYRYIVCFPPESLKPRKFTTCKVYHQEGLPPGKFPTRKIFTIRKDSTLVVNFFPGCKFS